MIVKISRHPICSWLWSRRFHFSPAPNDSQHRIDIFADSSSPPSEQFHFMPDEFHLMPDKFHYMPDKFHLMPDPTDDDDCGFGHKVKLAPYWNQ